MAQGYTAKMVTGVVHVLSVEGQVRVLREGDRVLKGETLIAGAGGWARLVADDAPPLHLLAERQIKIDDSMFAESAPTPASAALAGGSIARVVEALAPSNDKSEEWQALVADSAGGCGFVRLLRVSEVVSVVGNQLDDSAAISISYDKDSSAFVWNGAADSNTTSTGVALAAPLLLSEVLTNEAEVAFAAQAPGMGMNRSADPISMGVCMDMNALAAHQVDGLLQPYPAIAAEG